MIMNLFASCERKQVSSFLLSILRISHAGVLFVRKLVAWLRGSLAGEPQDTACVNSTGRSAAYTHLLSTSSSSSSVPTCTYSLCSWDANEVAGCGQSEGIRLKSGNRTALTSVQ
jgi:hypothetical protein